MDLSTVCHNCNCNFVYHIKLYLLYFMTVLLLQCIHSFWGGVFGFALLFILRFTLILLFNSRGQECQGHLFTAQVLLFVDICISYSKEASISWLADIHVAVPDRINL